VPLAGRGAIDRYESKHYPMPRNLLPQLRAAYGEALSRYNVLVMPADPGDRSARSRASHEDGVAPALEMLVKTSPLGMSGHPACRVPARSSTDCRPK
jgi:amidase